MHSFGVIEPTVEYYERQIEAVRQDACLFEKNASLAEDAATKDFIESWLQSKDSQEQLSALMQDIVEFLDEDVSGNGSVGHDKRHLACDLTEGLRAMQSNDLGVFGAFSPIPALLHDTGRLIEAKFHHVLPYEITSPDHPYFSFAIANQFSDKPYFMAMPKVVIDHILYAILKHSDWNSVTELTKITQSADRAQLIGAEGISRSISVQTGVWNMPLLLGDVEHRSFLPKDVVKQGFDALHAMEFYLRNLHAQCNEGAQSRVDALKVDSAVFLYLASPFAVREQIFATEYGRADALKKKLSPHVWQKAQEEISKRKEHAIPSPRADALCSFVFGAKGNASDAAAVGRVSAHFDALACGEQQSLMAAVTYIQDKRRDIDASNLSFLSEQAARPDYVGIAAKWALRTLSE